MLNSQQVKDVQRLARRIKDNWSLCNFLGKAEKEYMVATTIHACVKNHQTTGEMFSKKGGNLNHETRLCQNSSSYAAMINDGYLVEADRQGEAVILPTQKLIDKLKRFFAIEEVKV
jgi:hypothetical protein